MTSLKECQRDLSAVWVYGVLYSGQIARQWEYGLMDVLVSDRLRWRAIVR